MAEAYWTVTRSVPEEPQVGLINGIHTVIINADDGSTEAEAIADAETAMQAEGIPIPDGYFDSAVLLTTTLPDDTDLLIVNPRAAMTVIEA